MILGYVIRPKADADLDEIGDSLADFAGLDHALRFISQAFERFELIASQPEMGWPSRVPHRDLATVRVLNLDKPFEKYLIFYQPSRDQIEILRVLHGVQDLQNRLSIEGVLSED